MRFKPKPGIKEGDVRLASGFLLAPRCCGGEWRWFEFARWRQKVKKRSAPIQPGAGYSPGQTVLRWCDFEWIDPPLTEGEVRAGIKTPKLDVKPNRPPPSPNPPIKYEGYIKPGIGGGSRR